VILFALSKHAILTFSLYPNKSDTDTYLGVAGTSGPLLYTFNLLLKEKRGTVLHKIPLPSPGASACVSYPSELIRLATGEKDEVFRVGCWDNNVRAVSLARAGVHVEDGQQSAHSKMSLNCESSVYSVACFYNKNGCVEHAGGTKGGKICIKRFTRE
jgi:hypothetical protein